MDKTKVLNWWPVLLTLAGSVLAFGTVRSDMTHAQEQIKQLEQGTPELQQRVTRIETKQDALAEDLKEMKQDVKDIAKAVK
jgi:septal ring factor EnvC (AmiA/AmiB activator)